MVDQPTEEELINWIEKELCNWGKWGKEDELGTLNFITMEMRVNAFKSVKKGILVSCSRPVTFFDLDNDTRIQKNRFMIATGNEDTHSCSIAQEYIGLSFHGWTVTHIDCFSHFFWKGKMYNDRPVSMVSATHGAVKNSVLPLKDGIVTRGVLLDIPKLKNKKWLDLDEYIFPKDIKDAEEKFGIQIQKGDLVFVRTGFYGRRLELGSVNLNESGCPAPHPSCMHYFHQKQIAILGSDTPNDIKPPKKHGYSISHPNHTIALVAMGMPLIDFANLEDLSRECEKQSQYWFLIQLSPLVLEGCTGSPLNPIAVF
eukprot:TRINITY_DN8647_c0_g1_i1.p1 TRINITY_DN8647_c0_g1~~TRINITY_DN8647_c0_g1_i1.p1  ORF type:complete len:326 (-),score=57.01 TRINITY_DN8647_c0_g1_i1:45-983(-)